MPRSSEVARNALLFINLADKHFAEIGGLEMNLAPIFFVLEANFSKRHCTMKELVLCNAKSPATVRRFVYRARDKGIFNLRHDPKDRRVVLVEPTEKLLRHYTAFVKDFVTRRL
jgi:DNA-binding MarR family transcriptional regulator